MSDEQTNFKVTDRRLFNPDGTPRSVAKVQWTNIIETKDVICMAVSDEYSIQAFQVLP